MSRRVGDGTQLGIDGPGIIASGLPKGLSNPLCDGPAMSAGNALNLSVLFLIEEDLESLRHTSSVLDSCQMSQYDICVDLNESYLSGRIEIKTTSASPGITYLPNRALTTIGIEVTRPRPRSGAFLRNGAK